MMRFILNSRVKILQIKTTNMLKLKDYHNLYNLSDVLLLADIFENFRNICMDHYRLDPAWYFSAPGLAWDAALKITSGIGRFVSTYFQSDICLLFRQDQKCLTVYINKTTQHFQKCGI